MTTSNTPRPSRHPIADSFKMRCPNCGIGTLFNGILNICDKCAECDIDLSASDPADGPAFFVITLMGFLVTGLAVWVELAYAPQWWVHLIWIPFTLFGSLYLLRLCKAALIIYQFRLKIGFDSDKNH